MNCLPSRPPSGFRLALFLGTLVLLEGPVVHVAQAQSTELPVTTP